MYAVIEAGGKQERVEVGQRVDVELLRARPGEEVSFRPVLLVDGDTVLATPDGLQDATVAGRVVGEKLGPKIDGFTYKSKTRSRRRFGHRQRYTTVEISSIDSELHSLHVSLESLAAQATAEAEAEPETPASETAAAEAPDSGKAAAEVTEPEVAAEAELPAADEAETGAVDEVDEVDDEVEAGEASAEDAGATED